MCSSDLSLLISNYYKDWAWFPLTYVYNTDEYRGLFATYSKRLVSKEYLENMLFILDFESIDAFKEQYKSVEEKFHNGDLREYRYNSCFEAAKNFWNYMKTEELGTRN